MVLERTAPASAGTTGKQEDGNLMRRVADDAMAKSHFADAILKVLEGPMLRNGGSKANEDQVVTVRKALELLTSDVSFNSKKKALDGMLEKLAAVQVNELYDFARPIVFNAAAENGIKLFNVNNESRVIVIMDGEKKELANYFIGAALSKAGAVKVINIDKYSRPITAMPGGLLEEIDEFKPNVSFYIADSKEGEMGFRGPLIDHFEKLPTAHGHSPGLTARMMADGMLADLEEVQRITDGVRRVVEGAEKLKITSPGGTNLTVDLGNNWVMDTKVKLGDFINLPVGEIFTCPKNANGVVVIDGVLGDSFVDYGLLANTPVTIHVRNGRAVSVECSNKELERKVSEYIFKDPTDNTDRMGEIAVGTNVGITKLIGNLLQDEKTPGTAHMAFGDSMSTHTGSGWKSETHLDGVMLRCTITAIKNGEEIVITINGQFTEAVAAS